MNTITDVKIDTAIVPGVTEPEDESRVAVGAGTGSMVTGGGRALKDAGPGAPAPSRGRRGDFPHR